jgi:hypothetical protein
LSVAARTVALDMSRGYRKYTREILEEAAAASTSVAGVLRYFGLPQAGVRRHT